MIKIIAIGLWVCIATLGSSYVMASMQSSAPEGEEGKPPPSYFVGLDYKKTDGITVPIIANDKVQGYVLANFVYTIDGEMASSLSVPPDPFILDEAYRAVYSTSNFDFEHPERFDLAALTASIKTAVNARYKKDVVDDVLIEQFDFLPRNETGGEGLKTVK
jgi:flagellar basal body-associated protein FliL